MATPLHLDPLTPINSVVPFSYRDNDTYLTQLRNLRAKLNELIDFVPASDLDIVNKFNAAFDDLTEQLNNTLTESEAEFIVIAQQAGAAAQAAAEAAQQAAEDAAHLVGAPAGEAIEAYFGNDIFPAGVPGNRDGSIQATLDNLAARGTSSVKAGRILRLPPGDVPLTTTLEINAQSVEISGHPSTRLVWNGPAGQPMLHIVDASRVTISDVMMTDGTAAPSEFIFMDRPTVPAAGGTNELVSLRNVRIGRKVTTEAAHAALFASAIGIRVGGALVGDNDQFRLDNVTVDDCFVGLKIDNEQSIWSSGKDLFFNNCGTGIDTKASIILENATFNRSKTVDFKAYKCQVWIDGYFSEHAAQLWLQDVEATLMIHGGRAVISAELVTGDNTYARSTVSAEGRLLLKGLNVADTTGLNPRLFITGSSSTAGKAYVIIDGCILPQGDSDAGYVINGYSAQPLPVFIRQGTYYRDQTVTSTAAVGRIEPKAARNWLPPFQKDAVGANFAAVIPYAGAAGITTFMPPRAGFITAISVRSNLAVTAGVLTFAVAKNGAAQGAGTVTIPVGSTSATLTIPMGSIPIAVTDTIAVRVTTDAAFTPITANLSAVVEITT